MAGYHIADIPRGEFGEFSKIREEFQEAEDALQQNCRLMVLMELSDLILAIDGYLEKYFPGFTVDDLDYMAALTRRAFESGSRSPRTD